VFSIVNIDGNEVIVDAQGALAVKKALVAHSMDLEGLRKMHQKAILTELDRVDVEMIPYINGSVEKDRTFIGLMMQRRTLLSRLAGTYR